MTKVLNEQLKQRHEDCLELTAIMKEVIKNDEDISRTLSRFHWNECSEFQTFVKGVNNNSATSRVYINVKCDKTLGISTKIDLDNKCVKYNLW